MKRKSEEIEVEVEGIMLQHHNEAEIPLGLVAVMEYH